MPHQDEFWPNHHNMDVIKVESVAAIPSSHLSSEYVCSDVMSIILPSHPNTLNPFVEKWFEHYGMNRSESEFLQMICIDESVTWVLHGYIEEEQNTLPLQGIHSTREPEWMAIRKVGIYIAPPIQMSQQNVGFIWGPVAGLR